MINYIQVAKIYPGATLPTRKHSTDAGMDLYLYDPRIVGNPATYLQFIEDIGHVTTDTLVIAKHKVAVLPTGIRIDIPRGYMGLIKPKSGSDFDVLAGVVDSGYLGEIKVKIFTSREAVAFRNAAQIAQMIIVPVSTPIIQEVPTEHFDKETERGSDGGINLVNH